MMGPPPQQPLVAVLLTLTLIVSVSIAAARQQLCSRHPSLEVRCSSPHSLVSINNISFSLLHMDSNSSSFLISPLPSTSTSCPDFPFIPSRPINLSGTPLRVSDAWCSRLSLLNPCMSMSIHLPNCTLCPWHCSLLIQPLRLFPDCISHRPNSLSGQGCQTDLLGILNHLLSLGIQLLSNQNDTYLSMSHPASCICGFNSSHDSHSTTTTPPPKTHHKDKDKVALLSSLFAVALLLLLLLLALLHHLTNNNNNTTTTKDPASLFLHLHRSPALLPPVFTYTELESSTNRFHPNRKIGDGGFGSVYLGQLPDSRFVAVKHLHHRATSLAFSTKSFCNEILILSSIDHPNLVKLHGYCSDPRGLLLVYDYIPNGTLADHLHGPYRNGALTWHLRLHIALQIAMALDYLHFSAKPPIVHRDITTSNIFLDKDLRVKLGDFGLSRLLALPEDSTGFVWTGPQGTPGYLDPHYHRSFQLTEKSDVYSYGVVLMELLTGMKAVDRLREKREVALADMVVSRIQMGLLHEVVDPVLGAVEGGRVVEESVGAVAELVFRCVANDKDDRPDSREVVAELRRIWSRNRGVKPSNSNVVVVPES